MASQFPMSTGELCSKECCFGEGVRPKRRLGLTKEMLFDILNKDFVRVLRTSVSA